MRQLIQMDEGQGLLVEVEVVVPQGQLARGGQAIDAVARRFDDVIEVLKVVVKPFASTWKELSKDVFIDEATVKIGLGVTAEGNFFVAKGEASANIELELKLRPLKEAAGKN